MKYASLALLWLFSFTITYSQNCSFNGTWNGTLCVCDPGWTGADCATLKVLPTAPSTRYNPSHTDAWGASILKDDEGIYHMWVSIIDQNCDIQYWARNAKVIHATSSSPGGPFTYQSDAFPVMAHEIDVKRGPNNNWIAFLTAGVDANGKLAYSEYGAPCNCDPLTQQPVADCDVAASTEPTVICTANSPYGPWSDPIIILDPTTLLDGIDANFSAVVHHDGSLVGLWRTYPSGSQVHWVTATDYLDPNSYSWQDQESSLFPSPYDGFTSEGLEDMFVYYDQNRKVYHAIFHDMVAQNNAPFYDGLGHAFSTDDKNWTYTGEAASSNVAFTDGTNTVSARARPHFLIEEGKITHLITAEQFDNNDWSYTLIEPIDQSVVTSVKRKHNNQIKIEIFPNPAEGVLNITCDDIIQKITIYTILGKKVKTVTVHQRTAFDLELGAKGLLILDIQCSDTRHFEKVVAK